MDKKFDKINNQIKDNFNKAFYDLLEMKVTAEPPDYDWIVRLFQEIKDKMTILSMIIDSLALDMKIYNKNMDILLRMRGQPTLYDQ